MLFDSPFIVALINALTWSQLSITLWATLLGIVIGMLPGLTATMGLALKRMRDVETEQLLVVIIIQITYLW